MKTKILFLSNIFFISFVCLSQEYKHVTEKQEIKGGQAYILPKTAFLIEVPVEQTILSKGEEFEEPKDKAKNKLSGIERENVLNSYKKKYGLDLDKYEKVKNWKTSDPLAPEYAVLNDSIKVTVKAVPDYQKIFYVDPKGKWNKNQLVSFTYGSDGMLLEGESSIENKTFDVVVKGISGIVTIAASAFKNSKEGLAEDVKGDPHAIEELDFALKKFIKLEDQSDKDIYKDLKLRYEGAYAAIFARKFYKEKKKIRTVRFLYVPKAQPTEEFTVNLFAFDPKTGKIKFNSDIMQELLIKSEESASVGDDSYKVSFKKLGEQQSAYYTQRTELDKGFAYNIPLNVNLKLTAPKKDILYFEQVKVSQFGIVGYTNTRKREKLTFTLDPLTGELKKLSIEGKAVLTDQVKNFSDTASQAVTEIKGDSESTKLEKEVKRLENELKRRDLQRQLDEQQ